MKKDILKVFGTNLIKMLVAFISAFIIPMILQVDDYGKYKLYTFYASYIGITHLGYCDGIYLKYGGCSKNQINDKSIKQEWFTLLLYESCLAIAVTIYGVVYSDLTIVCLGMTVIPNVIFTFYTQIFQAIGDFSEYARIMNLSTLINLLFNMLLVFIGVKSYEIYIIGYVFVQVVSLIIGTISFSREGWLGVSTFSISLLFSYIKTGFLLMIGNFAYMLFIGIDKWFIQFTMTLSDFSMYSFSSQLLTVINMFITPVSMTLYSNMSRRKDKKFEIKIKKILLVFLMMFPMIIYMISYVISNYMKQYISAVEIVSVLLLSQIFLLLNLAVFVNMYKTYKKQKEYFLRLVAALGIACLMDFFVYKSGASTIGYAVATLISCLFWLGLNITCFPYMKPDKKEISYCICMLSIYVLLGFIPNYLIRIIIYLLSYAAVTRYMMRDEWNYGMSQINAVMNKIRRV